MHGGLIGQLQKVNNLSFSLPCIKKKSNNYIIN